MSHYTKSFYKEKFKFTLFTYKTHRSAGSAVSLVIPTYQTKQGNKLCYLWVSLLFGIIGNKLN